MSCFGDNVRDVIMTHFCAFDPDPAADSDFMYHSILTLALIMLMAKTYVFPISQEGCQFWFKCHMEL